MVKKLLAKFWALGQKGQKDRAYYEALLPNITFASEGGIARSVHHIYHCLDLPDSLKENADYIKRENPEYDYRLWDFDTIEEFIKLNYGEAIWSIYKKINPSYVAARADLARYLIVYKCGGVYLDVKSSLDKPLNEVIRPEDSCLLSHWDNLPGQEHEGWTTQHAGLEASPRGEFVQWYLAYAAGHPILREIIIEVLYRIDNYNPFVNSVGRGGVLSTTGPIPYSIAILNYLNSNPKSVGVTIVELPDLGFVYSIYDRQGELYQHKKVMPSNYWRLTIPVVSSANALVQLVSTLFLRMWYAFLDLRWKFSGKQGQRT